MDVFCLFNALTPNCQTFQVVLLFKIKLFWMSVSVRKSVAAPRAQVSWNISSCCFLPVLADRGCRGWSCIFQTRLGDAPWLQCWKPSFFFCCCSEWSGLRLKRGSERLRFKPEGADWKNRSPHQPGGDTPGGPHAQVLLKGVCWVGWAPLEFQCDGGSA